MASPVKLSYLAQAEWVAVHSSNVDAVWFQPDFGYLWIKFKNGSVYLYEQVPATIYQGLLTASSKGQYVHQVVRNQGRDDFYPYERVR